MSAVIPASRGSTHRTFTVNEILHLQDAGLISEDDRFELIDGEIIPMGPKYVPHDRLKSRLAMSVTDARRTGQWVGVELSMQLSDESFVEPDICLCEGESEGPLYKIDIVLLAIEVSATTLRYDLGRKARSYAAAGLREYWVVDVQTRRTHVHTGPSETGWASIVVREADEELTFAGLPDWRVRLKDL